jgi:hypothetical protein
VQPLARDAVVKQSPEPSAAGAPAASITDPPATPRSALSSRPRSSASKPSSTPPGAPTEQVVNSPAGTAIVRCLDSGAYLVSWSPAQGYYADEVHRGPATEVRVRFESESRGDVVTAHCTAGVPQPTVSAEQKHPDE